MSDGEPGAEARPYGIAPPGYRLPDATRVGCVRLQVGDLARSLAWYQRVLGLRVLEHVAGRAALGAHDEPGPLVELVERPGAAPAPRGGRPGLYHYAILLPERAALGRFVQHLAAIGERAGASDHRVSEALYLQDPDNLGIEVYADRPRATWQQRGGELVMATEPLDLEDLVRAAGAETWRGMPAGTTIGHVHLHVGELERARAFYHAGLGLDQMVWSYPGALFLSAGGYHHHLGLNTWAAGRTPAGPDDARLLEWELVVPGAADVQDALGSLAAAGHAIAAAADGGTVPDPWGTVLRVRAAPAS